MLIKNENKNYISKKNAIPMQHIHIVCYQQ